MPRPWITGGADAAIVRSERSRLTARRRLRSSGWLAIAAGLLLPLALPVSAQTAGTVDQQIQDSRRRLEEIRAERARLQAELQGVRGRVADVSAELRNIERQLSASRSVLAELEFQADATGERVRETTELLGATRERLRSGGVALRRRLRDIYKLGPLHTVRVLLGAESFADLLTRYRYVRLIASADRDLIGKVAELEASLTEQDRELRESLRELGRLRQRRLNEMSALRSVEQDRQTTLQRFRSTERRTRTRLEQVEEDEARLSGLMGDLEANRVAEEPAAPPPPALTADDVGSLDWPVEGELVYRFGLQPQQNGTTLRWNGIGIAAPPGTPVQAVRGGTVALAGPFEGYGPTVVISHGGGFYTLYLYLEDIGVVQGRVVEAGQVVGTVGGFATPEGPRLEFQVRAPSPDGVPTAQDPLDWLRPRGGAGP
ncbi:MAG: peptidoglycan DD-metalloendopeptidase family protein [Gemmatimonadetes bacterium]|nr:peptidoglycan DD-metalloendopeptidase family protein [Gemmatimonadota bacterium]NNF38657.1 peptidoglycan DD-metalloendopeptidase family protein [Gemmatimonadota bacterium]